ncbi:MAG: hypothetical protein F4Y26_05240 [Gammaproteobacteria bacterium]|nr:hypothetical protein [Gammaproteobacteria bacterium]
MKTPLYATIVLAMLFDCIPTGPTGNRPEEPEFDDRYWRELVYNDHDRPGSSETGRSKVWADPTTINVYVETGPGDSPNPRNRGNWPEGLPDQIAREIWMPWMEEQTPRIIEQLTGQEWQGRFEHGPWDPDKSRQEGWITIQVYDRPDESCHAFGTVGPPRGIVWLDVNIEPGPGQSHCNLRPFAHEMTHALGFWHARGSFEITIAGTETAPGDITYNDRIQYHARLAYDAGPDRPYCGWPWSEACQEGDADAD